MDNFTVTFIKAGVTGLIFLICIPVIANASGDIEIPDGIRDNAANSGKNTLYCNGTWCVMNEQYCDKSANKCLGCEYKKPICTQHLDCLQYCIDKGVEQAILENPDTATEENSTPAWSLPLFVAFLLLFLVSFVGHIVVFLVWIRRRQQNVIGDTAETTPLTAGNVTGDTAEKTPLTAGNITGDTVEKTPLTAGNITGDTAETTPLTAGNVTGDTAEKTPLTAGNVTGDATGQDTIENETMPLRPIQGSSKLVTSKTTMKNNETGSF